MTTDTVIEAAPGETPHVVPEDPIPRLSPANLAAMRADGFFQSRWLARLTCFGEAVLGPGPGFPSHTVTITPPSVGPELAESAVGVPVNYLVREADGWRCHWRPNHNMLRGVHAEVCAGFVETAWADPHGVMGVLAIFGSAAHEDFCALDRAGDLGFAYLCMPQDVAATREVTPWGLVVATMQYSRAISVDCNSLALSAGSRVLRQLARDEEPRKDENTPPVVRIVPRLRGGDAVAAITTDPGGGTVGTTQLGTDAVTEKISASGSSPINTTSSTTGDIADMNMSVTTAAGDLVIVTLRMREIKIENTSATAQNVTAFLEITDGSNAVINGDADDHWTFPLSAAGGGAAFVVVPVNIVTFDTPAAGTQTYKGRWRVSGSLDSGVKVTNSNSRRLQAIRTKR